MTMTIDTLKMNEMTYEITHERNDEVLLFNVLPEQITCGTSMDYFNKFPRFDEEMYYILENSTLNNYTPELVIEMCKETFEKRNMSMMKRISGRQPNDLEIDLDEFAYDTETTFLKSDELINDEQGSTLS